MGELRNGPILTLSPTLTSTWYPLVADKEERATVGTWRSIAKLTPGGWCLLAKVGCLSMREEL